MTVWLTVELVIRKVECLTQMQMFESLLHLPETITPLNCLVHLNPFSLVAKQSWPTISHSLDLEYSLTFSFEFNFSHKR